jgi:transcriptional regulator with XRE-family HTH domain
MKLNRIKAVLAEKNISQLQLAKDLGKSFSTINAYCCNRKQPSLELIAKIAKILDVDYTELLVIERKS